MAAIITEDFRRNQARLLVRDIKASTLSSSDRDTHRENANYAIGIGKSDPFPNDGSGLAETDANFSVTSPTGSEQERKDVINNLFSLKEVGVNGAEQLIARNTWVTGRKYKVYTPGDSDCYFLTGDLYPCYVENAGHIYLCLANTVKNTSTTAAETIQTSTQAPDGTTFNVFTKNTGYVWAHVQEIPTAGTVAKFTTNQFVPVQDQVDSTNITTSKNNQGGFIYNVTLKNGGSGYNTPSNVTATLTAVNGAGIKVTKSTVGVDLKISGGSVVGINLTDSSKTNGTDAGTDTYHALSTGNQYHDILNASIEIADSSGSPGSGAEAIVAVAPLRGFGANATEVLPTFFVGVTADFEQNEGGDAPTNLKFRQLSLIKNFDRTDDSDGTTDSLDCLKKITISSPTSGEETALNGLSIGTVLKIGDAKLYFDGYDASTDTISYHQNSNPEVNFIKTITSNAITSADGLTQYVASGGLTMSEGEYQHTRTINSVEEANGEVIFHENRVPFQRDASQTEEVKLIIQL